jgi:hypothetical protein
MAVFRVKRKQNFTVMSNRHLRDKSISLKAKGLLSQMLSLPEDWDYTLRGLAGINREQVDAVRSAVRELEAAGYVERVRRRSGGRLGGTEYNVYEEPRVPAGKTEEPALEEPALEEPALEEPALENPTLENPTQLNTDLPNKEKQKIDSTNFLPSGKEGVEELRREILDQIDFPWLAERHPDDLDALREMAELLLEVRCSRRRRLTVAGEDFPADLVQGRFASLTGEHVEFVLDCLKRNTSDIRSIRAYLLAALFHAPATMENYYTARVARDMGG